MNSATVHNQWIALRIAHHKEESAYRYLAENGYELIFARLPDCSRCLRNCDGKPLFPGYLFIRFDMHNSCKILSAPGFWDFLRFGNVIPTIEQYEIDNLRIVNHSPYCRYAMQTLNTGERVQVVKGPLMGVIGQYVRLGRRDGLVITASLMNRSILVEISRSDILARTATFSNDNRAEPEPVGITHDRQGVFTAVR